MPSFDFVVKVDIQEVDNAVNQAQKELSQRYDFKGTKCTIEWDKKKEITLQADDDFKLKSLIDILHSKLVKRGISLKNVIAGKLEAATLGSVRQKFTLQQGIPSDKAKELVRMIKDSYKKVQPQIQDEQVRVSGKKRDDLQEVIQFVRNAKFDLDVTVSNMRD